DRSGKNSIEILKAYGSLSLSQIPKIYLLPLDLGMGPWSPNTVMVIMIRRLDPGKGISRWGKQRVDISRFSKYGIHSLRRIGHFVPIGEQGHRLLGQPEIAPVPSCLHPLGPIRRNRYFQELVIFPIFR